MKRFLVLLGFILLGGCMGPGAIAQTWASPRFLCYYDNAGTCNSNGCSGQPSQTSKWLWTAAQPCSDNLVLNKQLVATANCSGHPAPTLVLNWANSGWAADNEFHAYYDELNPVPNSGPCENSARTSVDGGGAGACYNMTNGILFITTGGTCTYGSGNPIGLIQNYPTANPVEIASNFN